MRDTIFQAADHSAESISDITAEPLSELTVESTAESTTATLSKLTAEPSSKPASIPINAQRLRQARQQNQLSIEEAARLTSLNKMTLLRYECGDIRTISLERLARLAEVYGTSQAYLIGISPDREFITADGMLLTPHSADEPSHLGKRLLAGVNHLNDLPSSHTPDDHTH